MDCYTHLEDYIKSLYTSIGITKSEQLGIRSVGAKMRLKVIFAPLNSFTNEVICIDTRLSEQEQWQQFGHELCHVLWHCGNQFAIPLSFREYQEWKANNFAYHFCVPTFMLDEMKLDREYYKAIYQIQKAFNVDENFAKKRLDYYNSKTSCIVW